MAGETLPWALSGARMRLRASQELRSPQAQPSRQPQPGNIMRRILEYLQPAPHESWLLLCQDLTIYALALLSFALLTGRL